MVSRGALNGANDDRAGIGHQLLEPVKGLDCVIDMADRVRIALRPQAFNLVESQIRASGDDQIIVVNKTTIGQFNAVFLGVNAFCALRIERYAARCVRFD